MFYRVEVLALSQIKHAVWSTFPLVRNLFFIFICGLLYS